MKRKLTDDAILPSKKFKNVLKLLENVENNSDLKAFKELRRLLCGKIVDPEMVTNFIKANVIEKIIVLLRLHTGSSSIVVECLWIICHMLCSSIPSHVEKIMEYDIVSILIPFVNNENEEIKLMAAWSLSNIAGESQKYCDIVLQSDGLPIMFKLYDSLATFTSTRIKLECSQVLASIISNFLLNGSYSLWINFVTRLVPCIQYFLTQTDESCASNACSALGKLLESPHVKYSLLDNIVHNIHDRLLELIVHAIPNVRLTALGTIRNLLLHPNHATTFSLINRLELPLFTILHDENNQDDKIKHMAYRIICDICFEQVSSTTCLLPTLINFVLLYLYDL
jgi:hypothetical protein